MNVEPAVKAYGAAMETLDFKTLTSIFAEGALVNAPLYGLRPPAELFILLTGDAKGLIVKHRGTYQDIDRPDRAIAHFHVQWTDKNGDIGEFDEIHIMDLENGKIKRVNVIFDTYLAPAGAGPQAATHGRPSRGAV